MPAIFWSEVYTSDTLPPPASAFCLRSVEKAEGSSQNPRSKSHEKSSSTLRRFCNYPPTAVNTYQKKKPFFLAQHNPYLGFQTHTAKWDKVYAQQELEGFSRLRTLTLFPCMSRCVHVIPSFSNSFLLRCSPHVCSPVAALRAPVGSPLFLLEYA